MYVNDPSELALAPSKIEEVEENPPRDYHDFFYDDLPATGRYVEPHWGIQSQICRFDENGDHVSMAKDCPHFNAEDEEGKIVAGGWTAQQR